MLLENLQEKTSSLEEMDKHLLVFGLGNPGSAFTKSRHSLGKLLVQMYAERMNFPKGWPSTKDNITLYPSNNYMNDSGKLLRKVQSQYLNSLSSMEKARAACIVVHDELELDLGKLRYRIGGSHKGHNGVRSCQAILGKEGFHRISVGIGRCESRSSNEVASFVLGKFKPNEMKVIETSVFEEFSSLLNHIRFGMITKKVSSNTQGNSKQC